MEFLAPHDIFMDYLYRISEQWDGGPSCNSGKRTEKEILEPEGHRRLTLLNHTFIDGRKNSTDSQVFQWQAIYVTEKPINRLKSLF